MNVITMTNAKNTAGVTPRFACKIDDNTDLGLAMLIAEFEEGGYEPIATVSSLGEAREYVRNDMAHRMEKLERGGEPSCPAAYKVWARGVNGTMAVAGEIEP